MERTLVFSFLLILLSSALVSADILSLNSGGDDEIVITPHELLEGFLFGDISQPAPPEQVNTGGLAVVPVPILSTIELQVDEYWTYGNKHSVIIKVFDTIGNPHDGASFTVNVTSNSTVEIDPITRLGIGTYDSAVQVLRSEDNQLQLSVTASHNGVEVIKNVSIEIRQPDKKPSLLEEFKAQLASAYHRTLEFLEAGKRWANDKARQIVSKLPPIAGGAKTIFIITVIVIAGFCIVVAQLIRRRSRRREVSNQPSEPIAETVIEPPPGEALSNLRAVARGVK